jgi:hypothetical protein
VPPRPDGAACRQCRQRTWLWWVIDPPSQELIPTSQARAPQPARTCLQLRRRSAAGRPDQRLRRTIFLDEVATTSSTLSDYQTLTAFVHQQAAGSRTIVNFGTIPPQTQMSAGDIAVTFEGDYPTYQGIRFPSWVNNFAPSRFYNIIYGVPNQPRRASLSPGADGGGGEAAAAEAARRARRPA